MNRKTLIQLFLFLIVLIIRVTIFAKYYNEEKISKKNYVLSNSYDWEKTTIETFNFIKHRKKYV